MIKPTVIWVMRALTYLLWSLVIVVCVVTLSLRYWLLPNIHQYKADIEQKLSSALNQKVTIADIQASWSGMNPQLDLNHVQIYDQQSRVALTLNHVEAGLSWLSIPKFEPHLSLLTINAPKLTIRREANGALFVAGIAMGGAAKPDFSNWILKQSQIDIRNATIEWLDDKRNAPPLTLNQLNFQLHSPKWSSILGQHRFGLSAVPAAGTLSFKNPIDIRGQFYGKDVADIKDWRGTIYSKLQGIDLSAWRAWVDYPINLNAGVGGLQFWLKFAQGKPTQIISDVSLKNIDARLALANKQNAITLDNLNGRIIWKQERNGQSFELKKLNVLAQKMDIKQGNASYREFYASSKKPATIEAELSLNTLDLTALKSFSQLINLPVKTVELINGLNAVGQLSQISVQLAGNKNNPETYQIKTNFDGLGVLAYQDIPGFTNLTGAIDLNENNGKLQLKTQNAILDLKGLIREPMPINQLDGLVSWRNKNKITTLNVESLKLTNDHLTGKVAGTYELNGIKGGKLDFTGQFDKINTKFAKVYYPSYLNKDTLDWLDNAILAGTGNNVQLTLRGNAAEFPYPDNKSGLFKVTAKVTDGMILYGKNWPKIEKLTLDMLFQGNRMELNSTKGELLGTQIAKVNIVIPDLDANDPMLYVNGSATGSAANAINFINKSPVLEVTDGFTQNLNVTGLGKLNIKLDIPLNNTDATKVKGGYSVTNSAMSSDAIPDITNITGQLDFTETGIAGKNIRATIFDSPGIVNIVTNKDRVIRITANGRMPDSGLKKVFDLPILSKLEGSADWVSEINIKKDSYDLAIRSNMVGMAVDLPAPFNKSKLESIALKIDKKPQSDAKDYFSVSYGTLLAAKMLTIEQNRQLTIENTNIGINELADYPMQAGINVHGNINQLNLDEWREFNTLNPQNKSGSVTSNNTININRMTLSTNELTAFDRQITDAKINATVDNNIWKINLLSKEMNGDLTYSTAANGRLTARLKDFRLPDDLSDKNINTLKSGANIKKANANLRYPALDIVVEDFEIANKKLGRLEVIAAENNQNWNIEKLNISNEESTLSATGEWRNWRTLPNTKLNFTLNINSLGKLFKRFGYPETIKSGSALITGQLQWPGSPHEYNSANLDGNIVLDAKKGRIVKVETGIGRLFSLLSLQNLPRRLALDFKDVFNDGFAFDSIQSSVRIDRGIVRSDDFKMVGPTAQVEVKGETNLAKETQHLFIKVTPFISDTFSLAAFAGGPIVGIGAYIAQKLLKDPLNKFAIDEYEIVGTWSDPQEVEKDSDKKPAQTKDQSKDQTKDKTSNKNSTSTNSANSNNLSSNNLSTNNLNINKSITHNIVK